MTWNGFLKACCWCDPGGTGFFPMSQGMSHRFGRSCGTSRRRGAVRRPPRESCDDSRPSGFGVRRMGRRETVLSPHFNRRQASGWEGRWLQPFNFSVSAGGGGTFFGRGLSGVVTGCGPNRMAVRLSVRGGAWSFCPPPFRLNGSRRPENRPATVRRFFRRGTFSATRRRRKPVYGVFSGFFSSVNSVFVSSRFTVAFSGASSVLFIGSSLTSSSLSFTGLS